MPTLRVLLAGVVLFGCGGRVPMRGEFDPRDVSGNYSLTYDDQLKLKLYVGGAVREVTQSGYGGIVDFGTVGGQPARLDLTAFCARPDVQCPSEAFWSKVSVVQPNLERSGLALQTLSVVNNTTRFLDGGLAQSLSGLIDHSKDDAFLLGLGAQGASNEACVALSVSLAGGRFTREGERSETSIEGRTATNQACSLDAGVAGIADGRVFLGWAGGCAFGPVLLGATLTLETGFVGQRTGAYDPPPFVTAPVVLPDGGIDAGALDGGP